MKIKRLIAVITMGAMLTVPMVFAEETDVGGTEVVQQTVQDNSESLEKTLQPDEQKVGQVGQADGQADDEPQTNYEKLSEGEKINTVTVDKAEFEFGTVSSFGSNLFTIKLNNGDRLSQQYYTFKIDNGEGQYGKIGNHVINVHFRGKYEGYPDTALNYKVIPYRPSSISLDSLTSGDMRTSLTFFVTNRHHANAPTLQGVYIRYSTNSAMSNATDAFFTKSPCTVKGLKPNTVYYIQAMNKMDGQMSAPCDKKTVHTTGNKLPTPNLANTKWVYNKMKTGKPFTMKVFVPYINAHQYRAGLYHLYPYVVYQTYRIDFKQCPEYMSGNGLVSEITFKPVGGEKWRKYKAAEKKVNAIVNGAKKKKSDAAKIKYVNNKIKKACKYNKKTSECASAYGCLVQHKAKCTGYTVTAQWCFNDLGITNKRMYGKNHTWNAVYIKYKKQTRWWNVDVTWNDCKHSNKYLLKKTHR